MNNKQVAQAWAKQSQASAKGSNFYFNGPRLYSYGPHFLVAEIRQDGRAWFNPDRYSQSTTRHQSLARQAWKGDIVA